MLRHVAHGVRLGNPTIDTNPLQRKTLKLAKQWAVWRKEMMEKVWQQAVHAGSTLLLTASRWSQEADLEAAKKRAEAELATALDVGGQVYMFGRGIAKQFHAKPVRPDMYGFDRIKQMWRERLNLDQHGVRLRPTLCTRSHQCLSLRAHGAVEKAHNMLSGQNPIVKTAPEVDSPSDSDSDSDSDSGSYASSISSASGRFNIPLVTDRRRASVVSQHSVSSRVSRVSKATTVTAASVASVDSHPALVGEKVDQGGEEEIDTDNQDEWEVAKYQLNPYEGLTMAYNTAPLWGRRVLQVDFGQSTAYVVACVCALGDIQRHSRCAERRFAVTDMGEMFTWGGKGQWWTEFQPDSKWTQKKLKPGKLTERSDWQMTMGVHPEVKIPTIEDEKFQGDGPRVKPSRLTRKEKKLRKQERRQRARQNKEKLAMMAVVEEEDSETSDDSLTTLGSLKSNLDDNEEVRKSKLRKIRKRKKKKRKARKRREAQEAAEEEDRRRQEEEEKKGNDPSDVFLAGPNGENLYDIDPYALDEEQENKLKAQLKRKKQAREDDKYVEALCGLPA